MSMIIDGSNGGFFPIWTTATRPASPVAGQVGFNSTLGSHESYNGTSWQQFTNAPAFSAYQSVAQSITNAVFTKITFDIEEFDTNNNFASSRFTPTVAGYYQINGGCSVTGLIVSGLFKNGAEYKRSTQAASNAVLTIGAVSSIVYLNGSTDYVELYVYQSSGITQTTTVGAPNIYFNGALVRAA